MLEGEREKKIHWDSSQPHAITSVSTEATGSKTGFKKQEKQDPQETVGVTQNNTHWIRV